MPLQEIQNRINMALAKAERPKGSVELIAVSKVQPNERVLEVLKQGHTVFGENKVQEAQGKWPAFKEDFPNTKLHLIGPLQSNKVKPALDLFDAIHTLDRPKLAQKIANEIQARGSAPQLFIQVNTGQEPQKAGVLPADLDNFIATCQKMLDLPVFGLMAIPPWSETRSRAMRRPASGR